jgi:hypothetical protein
LGLLVRSSARFLASGEGAATRNEYKYIGKGAPLERMVKVTQEREFAVDGSDKDDKVAPRSCDFLTSANGPGVLRFERFFWPTDNPLFQGRWSLLTGRAIMGASGHRALRARQSCFSLQNSRMAPYGAKQTFNPMIAARATSCRPSASPPLLALISESLSGSCLPQLRVLAEPSSCFPVGQHPGTDL